MSTARESLGVGVINGLLHAVGGWDADGNVLSSHGGRLRRLYVAYKT